MKNYIYILFAFLFVVFACDNNNSETSTPKTTLSISNLNFVGYIEVTYGSVDFGFYGNTSKVTKEVSPGTYNIFITSHVFYNDDEYRDYFAGSNMLNHKLSCTCPVFRTNTVISEEGKNNQFNITKNTIVTFISGYGYNNAEEVIGPIQDVSDNLTNNYYEILRNRTSIDIHNKSDYDIYNVELLGAKTGLIDSGFSSYLSLDSNDFTDTDEIFFYLKIYNEYVYCKFFNVSIIKNKINNEYTFTNVTLITAIDDNITDTLKNIVDAMTNAVNFNSFNQPSVIVTNNTNERLVAFKGTPSVNTLIGGIPANAYAHGLEKKELLFNTTGDFILFLILESDYNSNKNNLNSAPVFTRLYAYYNYGTVNNRIYQISNYLGGVGQIIINNPTSWNIIIRKDSPFGESLGFVAPYENYSFLRLQIPNDYSLYTVFSKYNHFTNVITEIIPKYTIGDHQDKAYMRVFYLLDSTPQNWDLIELASSIDFTMTSGGFFIIIENDSGVVLNFASGNTILATSLGITTIGQGSANQYFIPLSRNPDGSYPESWTISGFSIGNSVTRYSLPQFSCKFDYIYSVRVNGENISSLEVGDIEELGLVDLES